MPSAFINFDPADIWDPILDRVELPRVQPRLLLDAADLPLLKRDLEVKLKMAQYAQDAAARARAQVEAQLRDLATAEAQLAQLPDDDQ
ncbi:hypothetical protein SMD20_27545 [Nonomuraea sp. LP-02]|uniref:hypothetical protein n=1 Tax=Nonomuraea sp. LP-02 TaxID=3097960 RepID=UPI002E35B4D5|nr:hypothetical protein [Nonomuraea sp. LP-02]MED7928044.1 hypothetical protein [Nonomuraea sp. LP-02]